MSETKQRRSHSTLSLAGWAQPPGSAPVSAAAIGVQRTGNHAVLSHRLTIGFCQVSDVILLGSASSLSYLALQWANAVPAPGAVAVAAAMATLVAIVVLIAANSYTVQRLLTPLQEVSTPAAAIVAGMTAHSVTLLLLPPAGHVPVIFGATMMWGAVSGSTLLAARLVFGFRLQALARAGRLTRHIAIVGGNEVAAAFISRAAMDPWTRIVGVFDDAPHPASGVKVAGDIDTLVDLSRRCRLDAVVLAMPDRGHARTGVQQQLCSLVGDIAVTAGSADLPASAGAITLLSGNPVVVLCKQPLTEWAGFCKTVFDRVSAVILLVATMPAMLLIAVAIKLDSPGPVLFRQKREGFNDSLFTMFKFRTMTHVATAPGETVQATRNDRRVTRVGGVLRRLSLDELPQLLNVLIGDMSLVGPRPHHATTRAGDRLFRDVVPGYAARSRVKPGITGWAQVQGLRGETRTERQISERVALDLHYIRNWSFMLDMKIMVMTLLKEVFSRSGNAY